MSLLTAAALGLGLGVVTGMPLGVINVAIVDAVIAGERRHATGLALGGAGADTVHALVAFAGVGQLITRHPSWLRGFAIVAAVVIVSYALLAWRRRHVATELAGSSLGRGVAAGVALTLPNPGALGAWVAVATVARPDATIVEATVVAIGVGVGSALWFTLLGRGVSRVPKDHRAIRIVPRLALLVVVAIAVIGVVRAWA